MRSASGNVPSEEAVLVTVRGAGALVQVRVHGLTPSGSPIMRSRWVGDGAKSSSARSERPR